MTPLFERFLAQATRTRRRSPGDEGRQAAIRTTLLELLQDPKTRPGELTLEKATERLEAAPRFRWPGLRSTALALIPPAVLLVAAYVELPNAYVAGGAPDWLPGFLRDRVEQRQASLVIRPLPEPLRKNAVGSFPAIPLEPPRQPDLTDPESLQAEIRNRTGPDAVVPPELLEAWQKTDPDNAWLPLYRANLLATDALESAKGGAIIADPVAAQKALDLCEQASRLNRYVDYLQRRPVLRQMEALRPPVTAKEIEAYGWLMPGTRSTDFLLELFPAKARELIATGDLAATLPLVKLDCRLSILRLTQPGALPDDYFVQTALIKKSVLDALSKAGPSPALTLAQNFYVRSADAWHAVQGPDLKFQATLATEGLKAGRYPVVPYADTAYHAALQTAFAVAERTFAFHLAGWSALLVLLSTACFGWAGRTQGVASTVRNLSLLYSRAAWARIFFFGLILPVLLWWVVVWHTRLGCRDLPITRREFPIVIFAADFLDHFPWLGQMLALPLLVWTAALQWARVERARYFAFLGLRPGFLRMGWVAVVVACLLPALYGVARFFPDRDQQKAVYQIVSGLHGALALWLLWRLISGFFAPRSGMPGALLSAWLVTPVLGTLSLTAGLSIFLCQAREREWAPQQSGIPSAQQKSEGFNSLRPRFRDAMRAEFGKDLEKD